ncbi:SDR family NAD(P)-dependent oxidoreductase [Bosea caraganae]|uniref:SDR family NAD(P)-dependent oxidoreductase n=1 Tax=Bosea caraganae TaxID=2763117 RepID=A0A370L1R4_9HYPH|nr:SDR family oxidoreductase [Bosea caraganae]RDJ21300.1 SDR family NAD(P)-dependent oxidoreductase [Bosea caraganae]RDJ26440.1 SDR family NAD(P)-dependent oxidoreductase [Bosea caraganae]
MYDVAGKVAVITGGTRGIGLAIAEQLLAAGGIVVLNGRNATPEAEALTARFGPERVAVELSDISQPAAATALVAAAAKRFGRLDILVHSAGGPVPGKIADLTSEIWMDAFALHVHPVFHLFRAAHPHLAKEGGAVLLISSVAGLRGCPGTVAYQTVKGALIPLAKALAFDHGHENIRVNLLTPGIIRTRFHAAMSEQAKAHNLDKRIPLRREGSVEDVASAALQMIQNEFITGEYLTVDGGMSMRVTG